MFLYVSIQYTVVASSNTIGKTPTTITNVIKHGLIHILDLLLLPLTFHFEIVTKRARIKVIQIFAEMSPKVNFFPNKPWLEDYQLQKECECNMNLFSAMLWKYKEM